MEKIKVLHITQSVGGVETYLRQVFLNLDKDRFELVVASSEPNIQHLCEKHDVKFYSIKMSRGFNPFLDMRSIFSIRSLIKKEKPKLVHLHSSKAGFVGRIAAKTKKCKSLFTPHAVSYLSFTGVKRMMFFMLEVFGKKFTHKILAISYSEANRCIYEIGIKPQDVYVIPNSLTVPGAPADIPDKLGRLQGEIKIGTIARLTPQKNPLLFVDIANAIIQQNSNVHFYFLGAGFHDHLGKEVNERIEQYGIAGNLHLIDKGDHTIALNFLRQLDIFLLPSVFEGLPYALLEAMLEGVPCVVSKCDGNMDVINNSENGFTCLALEDYVHAISLLINDKQKAAAIAAAGKQTVIEKYNISRNIKILEKIYTEM